jgi:hypothetical protein
MGTPAETSHVTYGRRQGVVATTCRDVNGFWRPAVVQPTDTGDLKGFVVTGTPRVPFQHTTAIN